MASSEVLAPCGGSGPTMAPQSFSAPRAASLEPHLGTGHRLMDVDTDSHVLSTHHSRSQSVPPTDDSADVNRKLTLPSSANPRLPGPRELSDATNPNPHTPFAIPGSYNNFINPTRHDVVPIVNSGLQSRAINTTHPTREHVSSIPPRLGPNPSSPSTTPSAQHGPLSGTNARPPRTSQVFTNTSELAAHYGIPQFLPPAPRIASRRLPDIDNEPSDPSTQFEGILSNYMTMLSQKPSDTTPEDTAAAVSDNVPADSISPAQQDESVKAILEVLQASMNAQDSSATTTMLGSDMNEYLTSPFDDSPFDDLLTTPAIDYLGSDVDIMTSPLIEDFGTSAFEHQSLFSDTPGFDAPVDKPAEQATLSTPNFDGMYTMSPNTPALDPASLFNSPPMPMEAEPEPAATTSRRKGMPTGTRKNLTAASLVPEDAPTQPRKYSGPSATSKKDLPAVFARKRARSQAFDEEDELDEPLPPNPTEQQLIDAKRRQNTVAARRSRKRKLEYQRNLEDKVEEQREEINTWKSRAEACQLLLSSHGIRAPTWD